MRYIKLLYLILLTATIISCKWNQHNSEYKKRLQNSEKSRPNILFLLSDDQRWNSQGCYGNNSIKTPNIDGLAREGVKFNNSFVTFSICSPSRTSIITGTYARSRSEGEEDLSKIVTPKNWNLTFPAILKKNGYFTGHIGKWDIGVGEEGFQKGTNLFDYWGGDRHHGNYWHERNCNFVTNDGIKNKATIRCTCEPGTPWESSFPRTGFSGMVNPIHTDVEVVPIKVKRFLESRDPEKPFFLEVSFRAPKDPWTDFPQEVKDYYKNCPIPIPQTANLQEANSQPTFLRESLGSKYARNLLSGKNKLNNEIRKHYRLVTGIDMAIGKLRKILSQYGVDNNTIIVFASDNGAFFGEHGFWGKWLPYEESIRVPLIIFDPRTPLSQRGRTIDEMVLNIDYAPTFLSFADVSIPEEMQGKDITNLISGKADNWRVDWYYEHPYTADGMIEPSEAVRTKDWKYICYDKQSPKVEQLFYLKTDPLETKNEINNPAYTKIINHLRERLDYYRVKAAK